MRTSLVLTLTLATAVVHGQLPSGKTGLVYPLVPGHGGVVLLPRAAEQPRKGAKAVFDITAEAKAGEVNRGLEHVARLLNLYGAAGLTARDVRITAVFHGEADKAVLSDAAYAARFKVAANPNLPLIRDLKEAGVALDNRGQVQIDPHFATSLRGVYAMGDRGGCCDGAQGPDEATIEAFATNRRVLDRPLCGCAVVGPFGHFQTTHRVALGAPGRNRPFRTRHNLSVAIRQ